MIPQRAALKAKLLENRRRLNSACLVSRLNAIGMSGRLNEPGDFERLSALREDHEMQYDIYPGWAFLRPTVEAFARGLQGSVMLAPYSFEEIGSARLEDRSLSDRFFDDPLKFDLDGFWIADAENARLVDFDGDHLGADVWYWRPDPEVRS